MSDKLGSIDVKQFWQAIGQRATGSLVVNRPIEKRPAGAWAHRPRISALIPARFMVTVEQADACVETILEARHFAIDTDSAQRALADIFGGKSDLKGADRLERCPGHSGKRGRPFSEDAVAFIDW